MLDPYVKFHFDTFNFHLLGRVKPMGCKPQPAVEIYNEMRICAEGSRISIEKLTGKPVDEYEYIAMIFVFGRCEQITLTFCFDETGYASPRGSTPAAVIDGIEKRLAKFWN